MNTSCPAAGTKPKAAAPTGVPLCLAGLSASPNVFPAGLVAH